LSRRHFGSAEIYPSEPSFLTSSCSFGDILPAGAAKAHSLVALHLVPARRTGPRDAKVFQRAVGHIWLVPVTERILRSAGRFCGAGERSYDTIAVLARHQKLQTMSRRPLLALLSIGAAIVLIAAVGTQPRRGVWFDGDFETGSLQG